MLARVSTRTRRVSTRIRRTSHRQGPRAPTSLVERMVTAASLMVAAYTDRLMRALEPLLRERYGQQGHRADSLAIRHDALSLDEVFAEVREGELSRAFLERMFHQVDHQAANDLQRVVPVSLAEVLPDAARMQSAWVEKNTELIRLEERARHEVRAIIEAPIAEGVRVEEIRARIQERMGVVQSRAELIARDQTLKVYGQIQEARQTDAGIVEYTWSTSDDERVRKRHVELEGTTQRWDSPPVVDPKTGRREHPGGDFQCRCAAIPILPTGEEAPISETRPSRRAPPPANDLTPPEERALAGPLPPDPMQVERERERLAVERAAREAEAERVSAENRLRIETENKRIEAIARQLEAERAAAAARIAAEEKAFLAEQRKLAEADIRAAEGKAAAAAQRLGKPVRLVGEAAHDAEITQGVVSALDRAGFPKFFKTRKLGGVTLTDRLKPVGVRDIVDDASAKADWVNTSGTYYPGERLKGSRAIKVNTNLAYMRGLQRTYDPSDLGGSAGMQAGATVAETIARTATHEFGHAVHLHQSPSRSAGVDRAIDAAIQARWTAPDRERLGDYAETNHMEYFAEAFAAYWHERAWMTKHAPRAKLMVEAVLRLRRMSP